MKNFVRICKVADLPEKKGVRFEINDEDLAVFKVDNEIFVISNVCPHNRVALIYQGYLCNESVTCPIHGWKFDLRSGNTLSNQSNIRKYETKIIDGEIFANLPRKFLNW